MLTTMAPGTSSAEEVKPFVYAPGQIPQVWEHFEPLIDSSVAESGGMITTSRIYQMLMEGHATAFATFKDNVLQAVLVLTLNHYTTYKSALVIACAGKGLIEAWRFSDALGAWALTQGAVELEAWCRRQEVVNLLSRLNWKQKSTVMTYDLRSKLQ